MNPASSPEWIAAALIDWSCWGTRGWPAWDDQVVLDRFGAEGPELLERIKSLRDEFYATDAIYTEVDLSAMGDKAASEFRGRHPELPEEVVLCLRWAYMYDHK